MVSITFRFLFLWPSFDFFTMAEPKPINSCRPELGDLQRTGLYASTETLLDGKPKKHKTEAEISYKQRLGLLRAEEEHGINAPPHGFMDRLLRQ
ncbi:hypothetical protein NLG97_g2062 [Lecanicillium saksenae]|uniref:Uncharacterized protein n=1 Tax=Lecanicillium saksenae TaxID=468837 RepID=A0ACC1R4M8_9HYPO|nr:hypothetical protein NLG97_g2062 [Lecanicillium saksenae]